MTGQAVAALPVRVRVLVDLGAQVPAEPIEIAVSSVLAPITSPADRPWGVDVIGATVEGLQKLQWLLTAGHEGDQVVDGERPGPPGPARETSANIGRAAIDDLFPPLIMSRERLVAINWLREQFRHLAERVADTVPPGDLPRVLELLRTACMHAEQVVETACVPLGWFEAQLAHLDAAGPDPATGPVAGPADAFEAVEPQAGEPGGGA